MKIHARMSSACQARVRRRTSPYRLHTRDRILSLASYSFLYILFTFLAPNGGREYSLHTGVFYHLPNLTIGLHSMWASQPLHQPGSLIILMTICATSVIATPRCFRHGNMLPRPPTSRHLSMAPSPLAFPIATDGSRSTIPTRFCPRSATSF
jgi:hypothetical protein